MATETVEVYLDHATIQHEVAKIARAIEADYGDEPVLLVGILKGAMHFLSDLGRTLRCESMVDFMQVASYGSGKSSTGVVQIRKDLDINIEGLNVILVEDIIDTGITISHVRKLLETRNPKSIRVAALLNKPTGRKTHPEIEYVGFEIPDEFVVGYGLDHAERFRNLHYIAILREG